MKIKQLDSPYLSKLNGFRCSHRNKWLLIEANKMSLQALSLFEFYIDVSDFDYKHKGYGTFFVDYVEIAKLFNCSQGTIRNWHKELIELELILKTNRRGIYELINPKRYTLPGKWRGGAHTFVNLEKNQRIEIILQRMTQEIDLVEDNFQPIEENSRESLKDARSIALGSSKVEYKGDSKGFGKEDIDWIKKELS
jgi:hypothetical protein